mgnify:FL=1
MILFDSTMSYNFIENVRIIEKSLSSIENERYHSLLQDCVNAIQCGNKVIVSGLGKNAPICEKFVGSMLSVGLNCALLHSNTALHGDMGMVKDGDVVVIISKSGKTPESVSLLDLLKRRGGSVIWTITFNLDGEIVDRCDKNIILDLEHEGDLWNVMPMNSITVTLMVLQGLMIDIMTLLDIPFETFAKNHPGGGIGKNIRALNNGQY